MLRGLLVVLVTGLIATSAGHADDGDRGTAKEAQTMVELGVLAFEDEGAAGAFAEINAEPPPFRKKDLYLFVLDGDGLLVANALHPEAVGTDLLDAKDANDVPFIRRMIESATKHGAWVDYAYENPTTGNVEPKSSWVVLHDGYIFGCGIYNP